MSIVNAAGSSIIKLMDDEFDTTITGGANNYASYGATIDDTKVQIESMGAGGGSDWIVMDGGATNSAVLFHLSSAELLDQVEALVDLAHGMGYSVAVTEMLYRHGGESLGEINDAVVIAYNSGLQGIGADLVIPMADAISAEYQTYDGVHPDDGEGHGLLDGQQLFADIVGERLNPLLESGGSVASKTNLAFQGISNDALNAFFAQTAYAMAMGGVGVGDFAAILGGGQAGYLASS